MSSGNFNEFISVLDEHGMNTIDRILNNIGYDREKEENERNGRERILGNVHGERSKSEGVSQQSNDQEFEDTTRTGKSETEGAREERVRFREEESDGASDGTIEAYEKSVSDQKFKAREAYQDSMLALKKLQDIITKNSGKALKSFEDAYTAENHLSSKNTAEVESYGEHFFRPIMEEIGRLINDGSSYEDIKRYVFAKHGLERNIVFAQRDARNAATEKFRKEKEQLKRQYSDGKLMEDEYEEDQRKWFDG